MVRNPHPTPFQRASVAICPGTADIVRLPPHAVMLAPDAAGRAADRRPVVRRESLVLVRARASGDVPRRPAHWHATPRPRQGPPDRVGYQNSRFGLAPGESAGHPRMVSVFDVALPTTSLPSVYRMYGRLTPRPSPDPPWCANKDTILSVKMVRSAAGWADPAPYWPRALVPICRPLAGLWGVT